MKKQWWKRSAAMLCSAAMLFGIGGGRPVGAVSENLITNSEFESNTSGWSCYAHSDADASVGWEEGALALEITALGSVNYAIQLSSNAIGIEQGKSYRVSFEISSTQPRYVDSIVQQSGSPYKAFAAQGIALTEEMQTVSYSFTMEDTDSEAKLIFNCGNHSEVLPSHTITLDNVVLEEVDPSEVEVYDPYEPPILINQLGYRPDDEKIAVFRDITSETEFSVIDADTQKTVCTGMLYGKRDNNAADEVNWYGDFSEVTAPGRYYITCGELDASYPFEIGSQVYDALLDDTVRMLYLQRCGCAVEDEAFAHPACHTQSATILGTEETIDVTGGWHDAGDYGRYVVPAAKAVADLLLAYDMNPSVHSDAIGIPESGNGVPDILDEARYEIEWMLKMQSETGGVYHKVNCRGNTGNVMPEKETSMQYVSPVSTLATADFCAVAAMASEYYEKIDPDFAAQCLAAAKKAWVFLQANPDLIYVDPADLGDTNGGYADSRDGDERYWAACQMYRTTGDKAYLDAIDQIAGTYYKDGLEWHMVGHYGNIALLTMEGIDTSLPEYQTAEEMLMNWVREYKKNADATGYETGYATYTWGSNMSIANAGVVLAVGYRLTGDEIYLETAEKQLHYLLGRNPNGTCYVTGYGTVSPQHPHHRPSIAVGEAMPGMLVGGVNSDLSDPAAEKYLADAPPAKCYVDDAGSYSTNEITIYWNAPLVCLLALTQDEQPEESIRGDVNADGKFTLLDVVMLQKWLLCAGPIMDSAAGDLCSDGRLDGFDLARMKRELLG
ncbi:MAG: glycoside hydrolase family 9 protein [Oscillospiraceae bacterium]|nr:glycoside hydrolase family 9 protein [Oscillospiraceae bacterium]